MAEIQKADNPFDALDDVLAPLGALNTPAELQGMLCGRLCGTPLNEADWLRLANDFLAFTEEPSNEATDALIKLMKNTREALDGDGFSFVLMLPDDDETGMAERVEALSAWCHGFLSGFGASGAAERGDLDEQTTETLQDMAAIVQVESDDNDAASAESDFIEVAEYVRASALELYKHFNQQTPPAQPDSTLH